ncbi:phenylacetate-CoA oxygenase, PaaJ subunit [Serratia quinivorans]|uniref:Phenylacetate-CoA oxygenase, PaaJ subunit n=1 Tax=Serratia quinivorans TaxID=137545 RepID=A0A380ANL7_9GAMM|nr:phenylacetate-CoA oxygenase, PaaJ subunit [Serratia quinivorans]
MNITRLQAAEIPQIWHCLQQISDPELPVLSITDLGMVRDVVADGGGWRITFTPTYSGCPRHRVPARSDRTAVDCGRFQPGKSGYPP